MGEGGLARLVLLHERSLHPPRRAASDVVRLRGTVETWRVGDCRLGGGNGTVRGSSSRRVRLDHVLGMRGDGALVFFIAPRAQEASEAKRA